MNPAETTAETGEDLLDLLIGLLRETSEDVTLDLTGDESTVVVARTAGRIFAAAWPTDAGLFVRLRLDVPPHTDSFQPTGPGSLAYESIITTEEQVADLVGLLADAHALARAGTGGEGRRSRS